MAAPAIRIISVTIPRAGTTHQRNNRREFDTANRTCSQNLGRPAAVPRDHVGRPDTERALSLVSAGKARAQAPPSPVMSCDNLRTTAIEPARPVHSFAPASVGPRPGPAWV